MKDFSKRLGVDILICVIAVLLFKSFQTGFIFSLAIAILFEIIWNLKIKNEQIEKRINDLEK